MYNKYVGFTIFKILVVFHTNFAPTLSKEELLVYCLILQNVNFNKRVILSSILRKTLEGFMCFIVRQKIKWALSSPKDSSHKIAR